MLCDQAQQVPVINTVATESNGIAELLAAIREQSARTYKASKAQRLLDRTRRLLAQEAAEQVKRRVLHDERPECVALIHAVAQGECEIEQAIEQLLRQQGYHE